MPPKQAALRTIYNGTTVEVMVGDMTTFPSDSIVNAANINLRGGYGIDSAIHAAAGPNLLAELIANFPSGGVVGGAYITHSHNIQTARHIIHAVGPNYNLTGWNQAAQSRACQQLDSAYTNSLQEALNVGDRSVSFPTNLTGIRVFPRKQAAGIALSAVRYFLDGVGMGRIDRVVFLVFVPEDLLAYNSVFHDVFPKPMAGDESQGIDFDEDEFFKEDKQREEDDTKEREGEYQDTDGAGESDDDKGSSQSGDEGPSVSLSDGSFDHSEVDVRIDPSDACDHQESSDSVEEQASPSGASDAPSDHHKVGSPLEKHSPHVSISSDEDCGVFDVDEDTEAEAVDMEGDPAKDISIGRQGFRTLSPPSPTSPPPPHLPAPPVAPRGQTCGANGGITKAGKPCGSAPLVSSPRCRFHQRRRGSNSSSN